MKRKDVDAFEKLAIQLGSFYEEISSLAKKSPNDALNAFKIKFVNATLQECNKLLGSNYKPFADFDEFPIDELPTNSDVSLVLSQYIECVEKLRADNIVDLGYDGWFWVLDDEKGKSSGIKTVAPKRLREKK